MNNTYQYQIKFLTAYFKTRFSITALMLLSFVFAFLFMTPALFKNFVISGLSGFLVGAIITKLYEAYNLSKIYARDMKTLERDILWTFERAKKERDIFEDGMESVFSRDITSYIIRFKTHALNIIVKVVENELADSEIIGEMLRWVGGRIDDSIIYEERREFLEYCLTSKYGLIRDGATLGLESLSDPASIPALKEALRNETINVLKDHYQYLIDYLEKNRVNA